MKKCSRCKQYTKHGCLLITCPQTTPVTYEDFRLNPDWEPMPNKNTKDEEEIDGFLDETLKVKKLEFTRWTVEGKKDVDCEEYVLSRLDGNSYDRGQLETVKVESENTLLTVAKLIAKLYDHGLLTAAQVQEIVP